MKKIFYIISAFLLFAVACEPNNTTDETPVVGATSLTYAVESIADHEAGIVKPEDLEEGAPVVIVLAEDLELRPLYSPVEETPNVNFKAAEHCLIGRYALCVIATSSNDDLAFLTDAKALFPGTSKFYLLSYRNGLSYTAAMQMPDAFAAYGCVSGAIDVNTYKTNNFTKPVSFVHVHATGNAVCKWNGVKNKTVSVPLCVGAIAAVNECVTFKETDLLPREGKGRVSCTHYLGSESGCDVKLYSVEGTNGGWCDEEFEVYNQIWNFFKTH